MGPACSRCNEKARVTGVQWARGKEGRNKKCDQRGNGGWEEWRCMGPYSRYENWHLLKVRWEVIGRLLTGKGCDLTKVLTWSLWLPCWAEFERGSRLTGMGNYLGSWSGDPGKEMMVTWIVAIQVVNSAWILAILSRRNGRNCWNMLSGMRDRDWGVKDDSELCL